MKGFINSHALNSTKSPNWVIAAVAVAIATASVAASPTRIVSGSAYGDAVVAVTLTDTHIIPGRAQSNATCSASVFPSAVFKGGASAAATATGSCAVLRDVFAFASGDAGATGLAISASALGEAASNGAASVVLCRAHIVHPGRSLSNAVASSSTVAASTVVNRYARSTNGLGSIGYTRAESSIKLSGQAHYRLDGFVPGASATATASVPQDRIKIIATLGSFQFGESSGSASAFVLYSSRSSVQGVATVQQAAAVAIRRSPAYGSAESSATVVVNRVDHATASGSAASSIYSARATIRHASAASGLAEASGIRVAAKNNTSGASIAFAGASLSQFLATGRQYFADVASASFSDASAGGNVRFRSEASGIAGVLSQVDAVRVRLGNVNDIMASATVGRAYANLNSDVLAPESRYMMVLGQDRTMYAPAENRTMTVTV